MSELTLVIVESPSKAKTISKYLGKEYIVRATVGHIVDLSKGRGSDIGVDIENGFKPKYADLKDKKDVIAAIVSSAKSAKNIIIASDPDREGEAIAFHVYSKIKDLGKPIKRAEFHEITKSGIKRGLENTRDLDTNLYDAQQSRRVLDRIVGFMVSPYLIKKLNDKLSAGRVQSVALRLVVDREREIEAFIPEEYWNITAQLSNGESFTANYSSKIKSQEEADNIKKQLSTSDFTVKSINASEQKKNPPYPLNTADLQKAAAVRFKFSADKTMKTAQSLYEQGAVTYIRSDSYRCSPESIEEVRKFILSQGYEVPESPNVYKSKDASQDAHEAIRPTDPGLHPSVYVGNPDQTKIYKLIWERFAASQMKPALYDTVSVVIDAKNKEKNHLLKANGKSLKYKGWLDILADTDKSKDTILPVLGQGESLSLVAPKVKCLKKETKPPSRYNDGSIIDELKKRGIGRPSTYAAIISKITSRKYITKVKNHFEPTETGKAVIDDLVKHFSFMSYDFTALMENQLDKMALGEIDYLSVMKSFYKPFREEFQRAKNSDGKDAGIECPICGSQMIVRHSQYGFFAGCISYPDCRGVVGVRLEGDKVIPQPKHEKISEVKCPECDSDMVRRDGKFGPFYSCSKYPKCHGKRKIPFGKKCSKCNGELFLTVFKNEKKLACMEYPKCKNIEDVPEGSPKNWVPPSEVAPKEMPRKVEKVLRKKVEY